MTTEFDKSEERASQPNSASFMEPRTIPKKWDVSAFKTHSTPARDENIDQPVEPSDPVETNTLEDDGSDALFDPFPQPRTVPGNWDVSNLV